MTATEVARIDRRGLHMVGGPPGLGLRVSKDGARSWILRATVGRLRRDIGLGGYPAVTLAQARERAREARDQIRRGIDPVAERQAARQRLMASQACLTFDEAANQYLVAKLTEFRNAKHRKQWAATLETYASPVLGDLPLASIELAHVLKVLQPIWQTKTETAVRVRGRVEAVIAYGDTVEGRDRANPAAWKGNLQTVLPSPGKIRKVRHHAAVPVDDVGRFMQHLRTREGMAARALEFAVLTAARSGEVRGATWDEIDGAIWTVPAARMKAGKDHRVPLSEPAVALLEALPRFEGNDLVFPAPRGGQLSDMALSAVMRRMEVKATPHGFRSTFRDWAAERTNHPRDVAEMALAHTIGDAVERAYRRGDLFGKRKRMMADWAKFCGTVQTPADVVAIAERPA